MKVLGLDMSTKTGYAIINNGDLNDFGLVARSPRVIDELTQLCVVDFGFLSDAEDIAKHVNKLVSLHQVDYIYIEQTNKGRNRVSQKQLEFIHCSVLKSLRGSGDKEKVRYVDTSAWRKELKIRLSKEDSAHNKLVKKKKARGKITTKHLAVRWANSTYNLDLLLKDNDIADAIAVATYGFIQENKSKPNVTEKDIEAMFSGT